MSFDEFKAQKRTARQPSNRSKMTNEIVPPVMSFDEFKASRRGQQQQPLVRRSSSTKPRMSQSSKQSSKQSKSRKSSNSGRSALSSRNSNGVVKALTKASKVVSNVTSSMATAKTGSMTYGKSNTSKTYGAKQGASTNQPSNTVVKNQRHPDYINPHKVELTPPRTPHKGVTDYLHDPKTPQCIHGAISAGLAGLSEKKPRGGNTKRGENVFLGLPEGMPSVITWGEDWEIDAGFGKRIQFAEGRDEVVIVKAVESSGCDDAVDKETEARLSSGRMDSDRSVIHGRVSMARTTMSSEGQGVLVDVDEVQEDKLAEKSVPGLEEVMEEQDNASEAEVYEDGADKEEEQLPELLSVEESEEEDPRNASMWVAAPEEEEDDDTIMNLGDIIVDYDEEFEAESPVSAGTIHIGDVYSFDQDVVAGVEAEEVEVFEAVEGIEDEDAETQEPTAAADDEILNQTSPIKKFENLSVQNPPFETPFSVKKGERALTYTEFKSMNQQQPVSLNQRVLFDPSVDVDSIQQRAEKLNAMVKPKAKSAKNTPPRYSTDWLYEENDGTPVKMEYGKRQLKGRVILLRIGKKISKVKSKSKNVLKQVFVMPLKGAKKESASNEANNMALTLPGSFPMPGSPSSVSVASIASSVMTGASKRIIGAIPVCHNQAPPLGDLYGTINYTRSATDSTVGDTLPPPPDLLPRPEGEYLDDEDAVSYIAAAMMDACDEEGVALSEEDAASIVASAQELDDDGDESVILVVTPREDQEGAFQVIGGFDGATPINAKDAMSRLDDESEIVSDLKPNNLQGLFTEKSKKDSSLQIMEAGDGILLTPTQVNRNTSSVFRRSTDAVPVKAPSIRRSTGTPTVEPTRAAAALPNLLPGSTHESDDEEEDDTLLYHDGDTLVHDGNTLLRQSSTFGDNTIATSGEVGTAHAETTEEEPKAEEPPAQTPAAKPVNGVALLETPMLTPDQPSFSKQAAKNGSFLFSENNMGRAASRILAQERAALKQGNVAPSLTMLPAAKSLESKDVNAIVSRLSYASIASGAPSRISTDSQASRVSSPTPMIAIEPTVEIKKSFDDSVKVEIQKKAVMSSMTDARQFSFKTTLNKFANEPNEECKVESRTSLGESSKSQADEMGTPLVTNCAQKKKRYPTTPFPDLVTNDDAAESPLCAEPKCAVSPTESAASMSSRKKSSPKHKSIPKSALKTRKGLVKDRISAIQQREGSSSSVTGVGGRLKKNHSYRLKNDRRMTSGDRVLAPKKATLQNPIFAARSVPIGISNSYSRDEEDASKYSNEIPMSYSGEEKATSYASKYIVTSDNSPASPCSSSDVSESTECDPFSTLLGTNTDVDEEPSEDDAQSSPKVFFVDQSKGKENTNANSLPFKARTLVKPTEINQHDRQVDFASTKHRPAPLSRNPMEARSWRQLAAEYGRK